ncbi:MAG: sulfatase-like hydrolase/transferase [Planctomycetota bacterium]
MSGIRWSLRSACVAFLFLTSCLLGVRDAKAQRPNRSESQPPNVLLICVDDLRPELNCFGKSYIHSPNIDRLAETGRAFLRHYVQAPTCGASRYALLTGEYGPASNGALFNRAKQLAQEESQVGPSLPAWFRKNGYTTVSVGKVSHHPGGRGGPDWNDDAQPEMPNSWDRHLMPVGSWQHPRGAMHGLAAGEIRVRAGEMDLYQSAEGEDTNYPDGLITNKAIEQLDQLSADESQPFFLAVGIIRPHLPFGAPAKYMQPYNGVSLPPIPHPEKPAGKTTWHGSGEFMKYNRWGRNPNQDAAFAEEVRRHYAACVSYADAQVGKLLDQLDASGQADNTIVVLWGDHGWHLGEHAIWGKHALFEESLHSPLIVRHPGIKRAGTPSRAVVETIDLYPTLCELAGLRTPKSLHGTSLSPLLKDPETAGASAISYFRSAKTIRTAKHRFVLHNNGNTELYDESGQDPAASNLAADEPELVDELTKQLQARLAQPAKKKRYPASFAWVNPIPKKFKGKLSHRTFASKLAGTDVGYCVLLPPDYETSQQRYPVVYYLHGGRPGNETKSLGVAEHLIRLRSQHTIAPMIYVFVNGGPVSHYNVPDRIGIPGKPDAVGADVFINELIPHIDNTYRTIADRNSRGLEGFSQGGRGTMRLSLRYPNLFRSVAAGGGGYETERKISESPDSAESPSLRFAKGDNTWDLARAYAKNLGDGDPLKLMIYVGTKGFNYENNLAYMEFLESLGIPHQSLIVPDVPHSGTGIYEKEGLKIMRFHETNFAR